MVPSLCSLSTLDCESCQLGKHTRATFSSSTEGRSESIFSLVHSDIGVLHESVPPYDFVILLVSLMIIRDALGFA